MGKTAAEIIEAHKRTIEVYTGKKCVILLTDREEAILKFVSLSEIMLTVEKYNTGSFSILSDSVNRGVTNLRKIFCLLANKAGYSANKTAQFLNGRGHPTVTYNLRTGLLLLEQSTEFKKLYNTVLNDLVSYGQNKSIQAGRDIEG